MITSEIILHKKTEIVNTIKLLIYKDSPSLLEKVDFEDETTFLEPLLFVYFNEKSAFLFPSEMLEEIFQGYFKEKEELKLAHLYNLEEIAYVPRVGYFKKGEGSLFSPVVKVENSKIEILKCPTPMFQRILDIPDADRMINEKLFDENIGFLTNAFNYIKKFIPEQSSLIEQCCRYFFLFKTNPENSNSFASRKAHGTAFFNIYQEEYDEVFFVDDIAHQTGHVILTTMFFNSKSIYKIDEQLEVEDIVGEKDHRIINILIHALYTYYTTFLCLDKCIEGNCFNERQHHEAIGRIGFYLIKCKHDLRILSLVEKHFSGIENMMFEQGLMVVSTIKETYEEIKNKWESTIISFDYKNQGYNFSYKKFIEANKMYSK